ncbi:type VII secretion-associated serine protease mycosin [Nonomuraea rubra]
MACAAALILGVTAPVQAESARGWEADVMDVPEAHRSARGKGVKVAVLDTGVVDRHPALRGRVIQGPDLIGGGAKPGQSYWGGHGTAMAYNVLSVAPEARVLSVRALWENEDPARERQIEAIRKFYETGKADAQTMRAVTALPRAIRYAADQGADIVSMSIGSDEWEGLRDYEHDVAAAVNYALGKGVVLIAAAGNGGSTDRMDTDANNTVSYPAAYPGIIAVAAMSREGRRAQFSQVHAYNTVAAPGTEIYSADIKGGLRPVQGTSPACALTAGVVALMLSRNPDLSPGQVRQILTTTARKPPNGYTIFLGFGLVNAAAAVRAAGSMKGAEAAAAPYNGKDFFDGGPTDQPGTNPPIDGQYLFFGGIGLGVASLCWLVAFLLLRRPRRTRQS